MIRDALKPAPLYLELADSLQHLIEQGTLRAGHRVPSVRRMSLQRDVSIATVIQAYTQLENRGFLEARPQSGYYVKARLPLETPEPRMAKPMAKPSYVGINDLTAEIMTLSMDPSYLPFGAAFPDPSLFPPRKLARLLGAVGRDAPSLLARNAMNWAHEPLAREAPRRYLQAGAPLDHDELVVTVGCTEAITLSLRAVAKPGDTIAIETPAYFGFLETILRAGVGHAEHGVGIGLPVDMRHTIGIAIDGDPAGQTPPSSHARSRGTTLPRRPPGEPPPPRRTTASPDAMKRGSMTACATSYLRPERSKSRA